MNKRKRMLVSKKLMHEIIDDDFVDATPEELFNMVWDITRDVWAFTGKADAEQRLQRNVTNIIRRRR